MISSVLFLLSVSVTPPVVADDRVVIIYVDNRHLQCDSRISQGARTRARIEARRQAERLRAEGRQARIVTLEADENTYIENTGERVIVRMGC